MPIDFFIHDTINDSLHNQRQFAAVASKLAENAVVHCGWFNAEFISFCESRGLRYQEVAERPLNHWYAGRRCGLATLR